MIAGLVAEVPKLTFVDRFGWMDVTRSITVQTGSRARWLTPSEMDDVRMLLDEAFPTSYARPGRRGVRRWAGLREPDGALVAVAADAWSAPRVGFMAGVATCSRARGRGYAGLTCAFVVEALLAEHGRVGLIVDSWIAPAIAAYGRLGFQMRGLAAARIG